MKRMSLIRNFLHHESLNHESQSLTTIRYLQNKFHGYSMLNPLDTFRGYLACDVY